MTFPASPRRSLFVSIAFNVFLAFLALFSWLYNGLIGCSEGAGGSLGILKRDVNVTQFGKERTIFKLPKGLVVLDTHATGADYFEPYRFRIVVTSDNKDLVDYSSPEKAEKLNSNGNFYSAK